jgi:hypothetical protein
MHVVAFVLLTAVPQSLASANASVIRHAQREAASTISCPMLEDCHPDRVYKSWPTVRYR